MTMVDTIQKALCPLQMAFFLFGLGILRCPLNHPKRRLNVLYIFTLWFVYIYFIYQVVITFVTGRETIHFLAYFMVIVNLFVTLVSIVIVICAHEVYLFLAFFGENCYIIATVTSQLTHSVR